MLQKYAKQFFEIASALERLRILTGFTVETPATFTAKELGKGMPVVETLVSLNGPCRELGLVQSVKKIDRLLKQYVAIAEAHQGPTSGPESAEITKEIHRDLKDLSERVQDDLDTRYFLHILPPYIHLYEKNQFDEKTTARFTKSVFDMEEAGKCLALERYSACVFHLMRILDAGLKQLGGHYNIQVKNPNWGEYVQQMKLRVKAVRDSNPDEAHAIEGIIEKYTALAGIRNPLAHSDELLPIDSIHRIEKKYTPDEAVRQFENVRLFMSSLVDFLEAHPSV
jgi:hypothetical protein